MSAAGVIAADHDALSNWIAPSRTAVLIIDMQVDFASPKGALGDFVDLSTVGPALQNAERLAAAARKAGAPVVFVGLKTSKENDSAVWRERARRMGEGGDGDGGLCREGAVGMEFYGPKPKPGELQVFKSRYSGFFQTDLDRRLRAMGVNTLVVCGLTTECCIDCTVRDAFHLDYHVFIVTDACAAYHPEHHAGALKNLEANCAILIGLNAAETAWETP